MSASEPTRQHDENQVNTSHPPTATTQSSAGFAAATQPITHQTVIRTDTVGLEDGRIDLDVHGQSVPLYYAQPAGKSSLPVVLVVSEIFGLHEHIMDVARRFAKLGYLAVAPEMFVRQGDASQYQTVPELLKEIIYKVPDAQVMGDLDAVLAWAGQHGGDLSRAGVTGFCWGGRITWLYAAHNPSIKAGVAWYGRLTGTATTLTPHHPLDVAASLTTPVLGLYGANDASIPVASIREMESALAQGSSQSAFNVYATSGHAFHADYRASYVEADAKDGWTRCVQWLSANGVA
ncbi:dienelactone hydrolase family protein [Undibacterium sp. SXout7W]|uniref:dienelactone hydrolase family protein n=1 Tax=Undibacterium sp. SXout7W TaxID=3413049 RepID=UPI003BF0BBC4